jgi:hypothetical protein
VNKEIILLGLALPCFVFLSPSCENLMLADVAPIEAVPAQCGPSGPTSGTWSGTVNYTAINGNPFDIEMQANISPGQDRVTTVAGQSGEETSVANRSGSAVSWWFSGSNTVTEVTLRPSSSNKARVTSRVIRDGTVMATGSGTFLRNG